MFKKTIFLVFISLLPSWAFGYTAKSEVIIPCNRAYSQLISVPRSTPNQTLLDIANACVSKCGTPLMINLTTGTTDANNLQVCKDQVAALDKNSDGVADTVGAADTKTCEDHKTIMEGLDKARAASKLQLNACATTCSQEMEEAGLSAALKKQYKATRDMCVGEGGVISAMRKAAVKDTDGDGITDDKDTDDNNGDGAEDAVVDGEQSPTATGDGLPGYRNDNKKLKTASEGTPDANDKTPEDLAQTPDDSAGDNEDFNDGSGSGDTGELTNDYNRQSLLQGLGSAPQPTVVDLGGYKTIQWATGPQPDSGAFSAAAGMISAASGASGPGTPINGGINHRQPMLKPNLDYLKDPARLPKAELSNGPPGGVAPAGAAAGMDNGGPSGGKAGGGGGGQRRSIIAGQLEKIGQNQFYGAGGSPVPVGRNNLASRNQKPPIPSKLRHKKDESQAALMRMFGSVNSGGNAHLQQAAYYPGGGCLDTVFCNMERFFGEVERYPNSEINWNAGR